MCTYPCRKSSPYFLLTVNLHVMALFQLVYVLVLVIRQCNADLFFIGMYVCMYV